MKAAQESRRRTTRLHDREGGALAIAPPAPAVDPDLFELREALDEELRRLPSRYREPLLLCELEGTSRREAAEKLGLAEGTLSSRLARGRSLLRDRLARRGLAVGLLGTALRPTSASGLPALVDSSVRIALLATSTTAAGTIPATINALSEGVLTMLAAERWKMIFAASAATLAGIALTVGLAWGFAGSGLAQDLPPSPPPEGRVETKRRSDEYQIRGVVVDEAGEPITAAEVRYAAYAVDEIQAMTDDDGSFTITVPLRASSDYRYRQAVLVRVENGARLGFSPPRSAMSRDDLEAPLRIVAAPGHEVAVRVEDADGNPVAGADVEVQGGERAIFAQGSTDLNGSAVLLVPNDAPLNWILAQKRGEGGGFDFVEFGDLFRSGTVVSSVKPQEIPDVVSLRLEPARPVRIQVLGEQGEPAPGIQLSPVVVWKEGVISSVHSRSRGWFSASDQNGIATFDWIPAPRGSLEFFPLDPQFAWRRVIVRAPSTTAVLRLARNVPIRGRVVLSDGSPARNVLVQAQGTGLKAEPPSGPDHGAGTAYTDDDGRYVLNVPPDEMYAVWVKDADFAAPSRMDVIVRTELPVDGVDFELSRGTLISGDVRFSVSRSPAVGAKVILAETGGPPPADLPPQSSPTSRRDLVAVTDDQGQYAIRVGPGAYTLSGLDGAYEGQTIVVADEAELVFQFPMPEPKHAPLRGRIVDAEGKPAAGAVVAFASIDARGLVDLRGEKTTDDAGWFRVIRSRSRTFVKARSADARLAGLVEIDEDTLDVVLALAPGASISGTLVNDQGEPVRGARIRAYLRVVGDSERHPRGVDVMTEVDVDAEGRFTLTGLPVGVEFELTTFQNQHRLGRAAVVRADEPGLIDLGILTPNGYVPPPAP